MTVATQSLQDVRRPSNYHSLDSSELMARWHEHEDRDAREELFERFRPLVAGARALSSSAIQGWRHGDTTVAPRATEAIASHSSRASASFVR